MLGAMGPRTHPPTSAPAAIGLALVWLLTALLAGCSSESDEQGADGGQGGGIESCAPPKRSVNGECIEPGVQDNGCPAGTSLTEHGQCQAAGIPPEACAEGFVPTDQGGCEAILPAEPCPAGLMAVPGQAECREVMPCGPGRWGDIPVDASTVYVDRSYDQGAGPSDGTEARPYTTVGQAVAAAPAGALVAIAPGSYVEDVDLYGKALRLWGKCPAEVELVGTGGLVGTVFIHGGADGSELVGLGIRGPAFGVVASGAMGLALHGLWIHDGDSRGIDIENTLGPVSVAVSSSLIERNREVGLLASGALVELREVVVRGTRPTTGFQTRGTGIAVQADPARGTRSTLSMRSSVVEQNHEAGIYVSGADADIEASVVSGTLPQPADLERGRGLHFQDDPATGARSNAVVRASLIDDNHEFGVLVAGSDAMLEAVVVRDTLPKASDQTVGLGIGILDSPDTFAPSSALLRASLIEHNHLLGVLISGSDAELDAIVVRDTLPQVSDQLGGRGIGIQEGTDTAARSHTVVRTSLIEHSREFGITVHASDAELDAVVVRDTLPQELLSLFGRGIHILNDATTGAHTSAVMRASIVERSHEYGVLVAGADVLLVGTIVIDTVPRAADGLFGDGVFIVKWGDEGSTELSSCLLGDNTRAGLSVFGAQASIHASALSCNGFHLAAEPYSGLDAVLTDVGGNRCSCGETQETCTALSVGLAPPDVVDADE